MAPKDPIKNSEIYIFFRNCISFPMIYNTWGFESIWGQGWPNNWPTIIGVKPVYTPKRPPCGLEIKNIFFS